MRDIPLPIHAAKRPPRWPTSALYAAFSVGLLAGSLIASV